uniref:lysophosphatidylserine lipase ABHD12-like n=1 Tax=Styela clava TaxID=7725 RepID=UPI00193A408C|nr:lysophosphatidylserine lipase ABHD12-like [Styela clava]
MWQRKSNEGNKKEHGKVKVSNESIDDTSCGSKTVVKSIIVFTVMLYVAIPLMLAFIPQIVEQIVFMNLYYAKNEPASLSQPSTQYELFGTASFRMQCDNDELGVWHVLPKSKMTEYKEDDVLTSDVVRTHLKDAEHVIVYHHGNGMSRGTGDHYQRPELYKLLQSQGYHIIAFDYRGFGDSTGWPSEKGLVNDSLCILNWVRGSIASNAKLTYWGHSLGSSIATLAAKKAADICEKDHNLNTGYKIDNLILEGALTNVRQGAEDSSLSQIFMVIYPKSIFRFVLENALTVKDISLSTINDIAKVNCPIMLLHAEDDSDIKCKHSDELYVAVSKATQTDRRKRIEFVKFKASHGYGHMDIYKAPELPQLLSNFLTDKDNSDRVVTL